MKEKKRILKTAAAMLIVGSLSLQAQNVSFGNERTTLKKAFEKIEAVSSYKIAYNASKLNVNRTVKLDKKNKTVVQALEDLLRDTDCTFEMKGNLIIIVPKKSENVKQNKSISRVRISGVVTDQNGEADRKSVV